MNYFAHARIAAETDSDAAFVLGSMLPDFAHMLGERSYTLDHDALRAGERLHHRTDAAFHRAPAFRELVMQATAWLDAKGLSRGAARGAAHVGIELLFDGVLVGDPRTDQPYLAALEAAPAIEAAIRWRNAAATMRWRHLQERLHRSGLPYALRDPKRVSERVARALAPRPRLCMTPEEERIAARWLALARNDVAHAAPEMLRQTLDAID